MSYKAAFSLKRFQHNYSHQEKRSNRVIRDFFILDTSSDFTVMKNFWLLSLLLASCLQVIPAADKEEEDKEDVGTVIGIDLGTTYSW